MPASSPAVNARFLSEQSRDVSLDLPGSRLESAAGTRDLEIEFQSLVRSIYAIAQVIVDMMLQEKA